MDLAVIVIDMQNGFVDPAGSIPSTVAPLPRIDRVIAECAGLLEEARGAGVPIVYTRHQWRAGLIDAPRSLTERFAGRSDILIEESWDADICDALAAEPGDVIVDKNRYDAFLYTDMELVLRALGAKRLLVTGVVTNICVESTVRSAHMRDFEVTVASDCTSAQDEFHEPSLASMGSAFATVLPWRAALEELIGTSEMTSRVA